MVLTKTRLLKHDFPVHGIRQTHPFTKLPSCLPVISVTVLLAQGKCNANMIPRRVGAKTANPSRFPTI